MRRSTTTASGVLSRHTIRVGVILLIVAILGGGLYAAREYRAARTIDVLSSQLSPFIVAPILLEDATAHITPSGAAKNDNGEALSTHDTAEALRIGYYATHARTSPFFALPGVDLDGLRSAVKQLDESRTTVASIYEGARRNRVREALYPIHFLRTLPALESRRRALVANPSADNARAYHDALEDTFEHFLADNAEMRNALAQLADEDKENTFDFFSGKTNAETFSKTLQELATHVRARRTDEAHRFSCFRGSYTSCTTEPLTRSYALALDHPSENTMPALPPDAPRELLTAYVTGFEDYEPITDAGVPAVTLSNTYCLPQHPSPTYIAWRETYPYGHAFFIGNVNELYFHDSRRNEGELSAFVQQMEQIIEKPLSHQITGNLYQCPDAGREYARAATLFEIRTRLADAPIFRHNDAAPTSLRTREAVLIQHDPFREIDLVTYLHEAESFVATHGERSAAAILGTEAFERLSALLLLAHAQSAYFDEILVNAVVVNAILPDVVALGGNFEEVLVYLSRSFASLTYLSFQRTVFPTMPPFLKERHRATDIGESLTRYTHDLAPLYTDQEVLEVMRRTNAFYRALAVPGAYQPEHATSTPPRE